MNTITSESVRGFILEHCRDGLRAAGKESATIPNDFDLLAEGLVDSLGIMHLVSAIEQRFQITIDLEKLDADQLTRLGPLSQFIADNAGSQAGSR